MLPARLRAHLHGRAAYRVRSLQSYVDTAPPVREMPAGLPLCIAEPVPSHLIPLFPHISSRRSATRIYSAVAPSISWPLADERVKDSSSSLPVCSGPPADVGRNAVPLNFWESCASKVTNRFLVV